MTQETKALKLLVLKAIKLGGRIVHPNYFGHVLALAAEGKFTQEELDNLTLTGGKHIFKV